MREQESMIISSLRFPLTMGVVFIHFNLAPRAEILQYPEWFILIVSFFSDVLPRICVPLFFFFSGYLFFCNRDDRDWDFYLYLSKLKKRCRTLLVPFVIWNTISLIWSLKILLPYVKNIFFVNIQTNMSIDGLFNSFWGNLSSGLIKGEIVFDAPLWYVRALLVALVLSPLIYYGIRFLKFYIIILLGFAWFYIDVSLSRDILFMNYYWSHLFVEMSVALFFFSGGGISRYAKRALCLQSKK